MGISLQRSLKQLAPVFIGVLAYSCGGNSGPNDLKEYGYKGSVKKVETTSTIIMGEGDGQRKILTEQTLYFNENGNIDSAQHVYQTEEMVSAQVIRYEFTDGRKSGSKEYDGFGDLRSTTEISWTDDYHYEIVEKNSDGEITTTSKSTLDDNFRDIGGEYQVFSGGELLYDESYENEVSPDGEIILTNFKSATDGSSYTMWYTDKEIDEEGNIIKMMISSSEDDTYSKRIERTFTYY